MSVIQVIIQLTDHSAIRLLLAIRLPDVSDNRMPTICCNLHSSVVHNHVVELDAGVEAGNLLTGTKEEPVPELHDVGLVDGCHLGIKIKFYDAIIKLNFGLHIAFP